MACMFIICLHEFVIQEMKCVVIIVEYFKFVLCSYDWVNILS